MKIMKTLALTAFVVFSFTACNDDEPTAGPSQSLLEIAEADPALTTLVQAIAIVGAEESFESNTSLTVLAPTNTAFNEYFLEYGFSGIDAIPVEQLRQLLYNHMLNGDFEANELLPGYMKTYGKGAASSSNTLSLFIDRSEGIEFNGYSKLIAPDKRARNGRLHVVDRVIALPTLAAHIKAHPEFTILAEILGSHPNSDFAVAINDTNDSTITVFAPTDTAFGALLEKMNIDSINEVSDADLEEILSYHVYAGTNYMVSNLSNSQNLTMSSGQNATYTSSGGGRKITDVNGRVANLLFTDIQSSNGIIHVVDKVMLPN
ncbi:MAG: fasciclin domain-containing protein [Flavobacterium sp.]|nr:fasciclin domain-containing protein [Flavobacterium sp.]